MYMCTCMCMHMCMCIYMCMHMCMRMCMCICMCKRANFDVRRLRAVAEANISYKSCSDFSDAAEFTTSLRTVAGAKPAACMHGVHGVHGVHAVWS